MMKVKARISEAGVLTYAEYLGDLPVRLPVKTCITCHWRAFDHGLGDVCTNPKLHKDSYIVIDLVSGQRYNNAYSSCRSQRGWFRETLHLFGLCSSLCGKAGRYWKKAPTVKPTKPPPAH